MSLYRRKGSRNWQCEWSVGGKTIKESTGTADRQAAQEFHDRRRAELWRVQKFEEHAVTFEQAALAWWEEHASKKRSAETDRIRLRRVAHEFNGMQISSLTTPALDKFAVRLAKNGRAPSTINKSLSIASGILRHSARKGWIPAMPVIPWAKVQPQDYEWLTKDEARALIPLLPENLRRLALFTLMTGLRRDNATHLEWSRVDFERRACWIQGEDSKNTKPMSIPFNDEAIAILKAQQGQHVRWCFPYRGKAVTHTTTKAWKAAVASIGRPTVTWHDLRHTWASWHAQAGTDLRLLMQLGGWSDIKMVLRYAHLSPGFAAPYASNVSFSLPAVSPTVEEIYENENTQLTDSMGWLMGLEPTTTGITRLLKLKKVA